MGKNDARRQKAQARKKAKRTAKHKQLLRGSASDSLEREYIREGLKQPIAECLATHSDCDTGMTAIMVVKPVTYDIQLLGAFVVDTYCLGVKDCFLRVGHPEQIEEQREEMVPMPPEDAKKLILGAVEYAEGLGFPPPKEFRQAMRIFEGVDENASGKSYTFGRDGKPFFIAGPHDSAGKCRLVMSQLAKTCGEGNYHYMLPVGEELQDLASWGDED